MPSPPPPPFPHLAQFHHIGASVYQGYVFDHYTVRPRKKETRKSS